MACLNISNQNTSRPTGSDMTRPGNWDRKRPALRSHMAKFASKMAPKFRRLTERLQGGENCPGDGSDMGTARSGAIYGFGEPAIELGLARSACRAGVRVRQIDLVRMKGV